MEMSNWISKKKSLPEIGQGVLVHISSGVITCGYRVRLDEPEYGYQWQIFGDLQKLVIVNGSDEVTHWMPLPEPPKTEIK